MTSLMPTPNKAELKSFLEAKYETVWKKLSYRERFVTCWRPYYAPVERVLKYIPNGSSVLDIGCGTGSILFLAREYCGIKEGHGVDISQRAVDIAESVNNDACISFGVKRIYELKQRDLQGFNVILCFDILHHLKGNELLFFF